MKQIYHIILLFIIIQPLSLKADYKSNSVLATGKWIKVATKEEGIHKISYQQLSDWGISNPENVSIYGNGGHQLPMMNNVLYPDDLVKLPVVRSKDNNGSNCIFFYATGPVQWSYNDRYNIFDHHYNLYSDKSYFFITSDRTKSTVPVNREEVTQESTTSLDTYNEYFFEEEENINFQHSGAYWYSKVIYDGGSYSSEFSFPNIAPGTEPILKIGGVSISNNKGRADIIVNGSLAESWQLSKVDIESSSSKEKRISIPNRGTYEVQIDYEVESAGGEFYLDYITFNLKSKLLLNGPQLSFRNTASLNNMVVEWKLQTNSSSPVIWDVTTPYSPKNINYNKNGNFLMFKESTDNIIPQYVAFDPAKSGFKTAEFVEEVANQNIHGLPGYEMIIITHPNFIEPSEELAEYHRQTDRLSVLVLKSFDIYNEFSSGLPDPVGIRKMLQFFRDKTKGQDDSLKYVLLMGDGSYDNRHFDGREPNFLPTFQSEYKPSHNTITSDDLFVLLDEDEGEFDSGFIDLGIGRIPCETVAEANIAVAKTMEYASKENLGNWRNVVTFMADDENGNQWMIDSENIIEIINNEHPEFFPEKIYFDSYNQVTTSSGERYPDATKAIKRRIEDGTLILNYIGHANKTSMADEDVIQKNDIIGWNNREKLPVFVTATCEFTQFEAEVKSAGEQVLFNPAGGGVALFSTTRKVYGSANYKLSANFYKAAFTNTESGENLRMGDLIRIAKNNTTDKVVNKRSFALFGDPALRLAFPRQKVVTTSINGQPIEDSITVGALEKVTIAGEVRDNFNNIMADFNGEVNATIYDKELTTQTLGNDGAKFEYKTRANVIYKGTSTVSNGKFTMSFIIPKDITYNTDTGMIYYYASNDSIDANGAANQFLIGGSSENPVSDNTPPEIDIYLNNDDFESYDNVSSSSLLMVELFDESGINTVGTGIGHDIVAIIDDDYTNPIILNEFYAADADTYQSGRVIFPISDLSPGEHKISIKAWDILNNSHTEEIYFVVQEGFEITSVSNSPNPVDFYTEFNISHNLPGDQFVTLIEIFDLMGRKVFDLQETIGSYGTTENTIRWDITDTNVPLGNHKFLVYRVTMQNQQGASASGAGKLLLNNF